MIITPKDLISGLKSYIDTRKKTAIKYREKLHEKNQHTYIVKR